MPRHADAASAQGIDAVVGDARRLEVPDASQDVVLLTGPLYHLPDPPDRATALAEAIRVTRPGGLVVVAATTRGAALLDQAVNRSWDADVRNRASVVLVDGRNDPSLGFTIAYFHTPFELAVEMSAAGLVEVAVRAVEGPLGYAVDAAADEQQTDQIERAASLAAMVQDEESMMGTSPHVLAIGRVGASIGGSADGT